MGSNYFRQLGLIVAVPIVCFMCINSCHNPFDSNIGSASVDTIKVTNVQYKDLWTNICIDKLIPLETNENSVVGLIHKIDIFDKYLIVQDLFNHKLVAFDTSGSFLHQYGRKGNGPGEYGDIRGYTLYPPNREIIILSYKNIDTYNLDDGAFLSNEKIKLPPGLYSPFRLIKLEENEYLFWNANLSGIDLDSNQQPALCLVRNMKVIEEFFPLKDYVSLIPRFFRHGEFWYIMPLPTSYSLYKVNNKSINEAYYLDFDNNGIPLDLALKPLTEHDMKEFYESQFFKGIDSFFELEKYIYFTCAGPKSFNYEFLYCKVTKETKGRIKKGYNPTIYCIDKDGWVYGSIDNHVLDLYLKGKISQSNSLLDEVVKRLGNSFSVEDNPILIKFKPYN